MCNIRDLRYSYRLIFPKISYIFPLIKKLSVLRRDFESIYPSISFALSHPIYFRVGMKSPARRDKFNCAFRDESSNKPSEFKNEIEAERKRYLRGCVFSHLNFISDASRAELLTKSPAQDAACTWQVQSSVV